jgi:hypothetical protein
VAFGQEHPEQYAILSSRPIEDATALWVALHGCVSLRAAIPDYPWPPEDVVLTTSWTVSRC